MVLVLTGELPLVDNSYMSICCSFSSNNDIFALRPVR